MCRLLLCAALVQLLILQACAIGPRHITKSDGTTTVLLDLPPREMWGWFDNVDGYCGECSFQSVSLYYGNYISQEEVRYADGNEELLVAVNDEKTAKALRLDYDSWNYDQKTPQSTNFLKWVTGYIDDGVPVISGWYIREKNGQGDADYDHIMPIVGYEKNSDGSVAGVYHNDLYLQSHTYTSKAELFATRSGCSQSSTPKRPYDYCLPTNVDYGIAILGILDPKQETLRTKLNVSNWDEPDWGKEDNIHDKPVSVKVSATVSGLQSGVTYSILRFDDARSVPSTNSGFMKGSWTEKYTFKATATTHVYNDLDPIQSDGTYFFRTVVGS